MRPVRPVGPVGPVGPVPIGPVGPVGPVEPVGPVGPVGPVPIGPVGPVGPVRPVVPVKPGTLSGINPIEIKWALDDFKNLPIYQKLITFLQSEETLKLFKTISDIPNLENDPHLHGAGIHCHPQGGKLDVHLDYSIHPISGKERRLNLIIYLNKYWEEEWNGALELWKPYENDKNPKECIKKIYPIYNRAVLFQTNNISLHGLPEVIKCPENEFRKSFAIYYVSEPTINAMTRYIAEYFPRPNEDISENLKKLYEIRKERRLSNSDIKLYLPDWKNMS